MRRADWSKDEDTFVTSFYAAPVPFPGVVRTPAEGSVDFHLTGPGAEPGQTMHLLPAGSGKTFIISQLALQATGFSASARALTRAGVSTEMLRFFTSARQSNAVRVFNGAFTWPAGPPVPAYVRIDGRSATEKTIGCAPILTLTVGVDAGVARMDEPAGQPATRLHRLLQVGLQIAAEVLLDLGRVLAELAMAARSRCGLPAAPQPTAPPGAIIRSHPRVPRGPGAASGTATIWPTGGMLSMA